MLHHIRSPEWASARRVAQHRRRELALCEKQEKSVRRRIDVAKAREREKALGLPPGSTSQAAGGGMKAAADGSSAFRRSGMTTPGKLSLAGSARMSSSTGGRANYTAGHDDEEEDVDELRRELQALYRHKVLSHSVSSMFKNRC